MIHTLLNADRVAAPWPSTGRWLAWLVQAAAAVARLALRLCGFNREMPEMRMSRDWLEEHDRQSRKHPDGV
jgi:hypothetical protein